MNAGEFVRADDWVFAGRSKPLKGRKSWGFVGESVRVEMRGKVAELRFFEIWKTAISRQTMDKILRQCVRLRKDVHIVAPKNSLFWEIMRVDFDI